MEQQNTNSQNQQGIMHQPPGIISTKDFLYLSDMMSWNLLAAKKANFYAEQCQDPDIKAAAKKCGQMHETHYNRFLQHLGEHANGQQPLNNMQ